MTSLQIAGLVIAGLIAAYVFARICAEGAFRIAAAAFEEDAMEREPRGLSDRDSFETHGDING